MQALESAAGVCATWRGMECHAKVCILGALRVGGWLQVRKLAAEVYGAHEQNGEWNDEGEWHVVGDEDLESSDDDLLGSDIESSSDDGDDGDDLLDLGDDGSSGDDWDSEDGDFEGAYDDAGMPILMPGQALRLLCLARIVF